MMTGRDIWISLGINLFAGVLIFVLGLAWPILPKSYRMWKLTRFWGRGVLGDDFVIAYGSLLDSRLAEQSPPQFRFLKRFHDSRTVTVAGPTGPIVGDSEIRSISYLASSLGRFRPRALGVIRDAEAFGHLNRSFVALGSPSSNEITDLALREPANAFLRFGQDNEGTYIEHVSSGQKMRGFEPPILRDYGIVLKIPNARFQGHHFFVCAGRGEWGTSGAAWYLATKWEQRSQDPSFGLVVDVEIGSDESARKIALG